MSQLVRWLGVKAEELGVEIYPGFAASEVFTVLWLNNAITTNLSSHFIIYWQILYDTSDKVIGIATNDMGVAKDGSKKETFQRGVELTGKFFNLITLFVSLDGSLGGGCYTAVCRYRDFGGSYWLQQWELCNKNAPVYKISIAFIMLTNKPLGF